MISAKLLFIVSAICVASAAAKEVKLPKGFIICKQSDPKLTECMKNAAKINAEILYDGYPELDFPPSQPLKLSPMDVSTGNEGGPVFYTFTLSNIVGDYVITNFDEFSVDHEKKVISAIENLKFLAINATHTSKGRLFFGQVNGKGAAKVTFEEPSLRYQLNFTLVKKDGEDYLHVDSIKTKISAKKIHGYFENLIGRDKNINDALNKVVNENWKLIFVPTFPKMENGLSVVLKERMNQFFSQVPYAQLFPK